MCGICGITRPGNPVDPKAAAWLARRMIARMSHRGPDGGGVFGDHWGAIGANRLAIRSTRDDQPPLIVHSSGIVVACNGEIDNHRLLRAQLRERGHHFARTSDVEVIAPLYLEHGIEFARHLSGAFAIALWDPRRQQLLLVRDRAGERHLYYASEAGMFAFASELCALREARPPDGADMRHLLPAGLTQGYLPAAGPDGAAIRKVAPGSMVIVGADGVRRHDYWQCPIGRRPLAPADVRGFDSVFRAAVFRQTDVDVDFGVLLSGGVDSSLITAVARTVRPDRHPRAYGIRFAETSFDEGDVAARVADRLDCEYVPVTVTADALPGTLRDLVHTTGEPLADPAWIPMSLVARRAAEDVRIVLGGEGADELFGGYPTYMGAQLAARYRRLPSGLRTLLERGIDRLPVSDRKMTVSFLLKRFVHGQQLDAARRHQQWTASISAELLQRLGVASQPLLPEPPESAIIDTLQRHDFNHPLPEALLAKADRGGMRHALEVRAPFLDRQVIEFAARLPPKARVRGLRTKVFLKRYASAYLPRDIVYRRKRGLSLPLTAWLRGPLHAWARERLGNPHLVAAGIDTTVARALLADHAARRHDHARALWTLLVFSEWLDWLAAPMSAIPSDTLADIPVTVAPNAENSYV